MAQHPKKITVNGETYDITDGDTIDLRSKMSMPDLREAMTCDIISSFLRVLRDSDFFIRYIYTRGGCYQLYKVLRVLWPDAQPYALGCGKEMMHVATRICGLLWDIDGEVKDGDNEFHPMTPDEIAIAEEWSFAANNDLYFGECPVCEQPIKIDRKKLLENQ